MRFFYAFFCVHPDIKRQFRREMRDGFSVINPRKQLRRDTRVNTGKKQGKHRVKKGKP